MNIGNNPELLDKLAASYALGTLRSGARRRLEAYARQSAAVRAPMLLWQERMCAMTELAPPMVPSPNVWKRIENALLLEAEALRQDQTARSSETLLQNALNKMHKVLSWWRMGTVAGALATVAAVGVGLHNNNQLDGQIGQLAQQLKDSPKLEYVAVLSDDQSAASMLVTFDPSKNSLTLKRVGAYKEESGKSLQLWALPASGGPQSLGVLGSEKVVRISAPASQVITIPMLAISLEPQGGVPSAKGPTGPVLFKGALLQAGQ
jgi:anti-sigma-K factor RskA